MIDSILKVFLSVVLPIPSLRLAVWTWLAERRTAKLERIFDEMTRDGDA